MMQGSETVLPSDTLITHDARHHHHHHHYHHPATASVCVVAEEPSPIAAAVLALKKVLKCW
jgi:hypothetical protein